MAGANDRNAIRLDPESRLYSNISRRFDAHRTNMDIDRHVNQFWFQLYYSRPGTNLDADTKSYVRLNASLVAGKMIGKKVLDATRARSDDATWDAIRNAHRRDSLGVLCGVA
ncbi:hypothetical protein [Burkholderia ambifaria]|uniref:hypothetical protein n=1 Tax=Burkholderia ambifaria TaxID=152480 RepID=UPI001F2E7C19|nr:hypothetical protein [Burkholderia ambifaria]